MDLGEAAVHLACVEVGGVDPVGVQTCRTVEAHRLETTELGFEVVDEHTDMMEALLARREHVAVDRRRVVVLFDELNVHVAEVAERIRHVGFVVGASIVEAIGAMVRRDDERPSAKHLAPTVDRGGEVVDEVCLLKQRIPVEGHQPASSASV